MTIEDLQPLLISGDIEKIKTIFDVHCGVNDLLETFKQYNLTGHNVMDPTKRRDKKIEDEKGKLLGTVTVCRLPLPIQKKIVKTAAMFLGAPEIQSTPKGEAEEKMTAGLLKIWDDNKMIYKFKEIVKKALSERRSAMLWYTQKADEGYWAGTNISSTMRLRVRILCASFGDTLYPVYDDFGDMIAFGRYYKIKNIEGNEVQYFDIYTADRFYFNSNASGTWETNIFVDNPLLNIKGDNKPGVPNEIGKIPVIYFSSPLAWEDVQLLIERLETIGSKHGDTNDYNGMPILLASGKIVKMSGKEESGKVVELEQGATLDYLTNNAAPESVKMEMERLDKYIYSLSHTPDISFENLKNLGYFSTAAFKAFFIDAHLNASDNEQIFGEGAQRMINYHKAALAIFDKSLQKALPMSVKPKFTYFLPENFVEDISNIKTSLDAGIISQETAVKLNPLVQDPEAELEAIEAENNGK